MGLDSTVRLFNSIFFARAHATGHVTCSRPEWWSRKIENYGKEDFLAKTFYRLRKFGQNWMFDEFSVSSCIHAGGFIPVTIMKIDGEFKVKFLKHVFGEGKRVTKSVEGRDFISTEGRFDIWTDM